MKTNLSITIKTYCVMLSAILLSSSQSYAEEISENNKDHENIFTAGFENDVFADEDNNYTNGVRFAFLSAENNIPDWLENGANALPFFANEGNKRWHIAFGQSIFTPSDISQSELQVNDRPYAGWLYSSIGLLSDTGSRLDNLQLTLGVVGPASGAKATQKFVHDIVNSPDPKGWDNQLHNELGVLLTYERKWRGLYEFSPFGWGFDITPSIGAALGNVYTHASVGAVARFGYDLPSDYGPPLIRPNLPGSDFFVPNKDFGWYLFAGFEGRAVARNIFLDGNTFKNSHSVEKYPLVGGIQTGIAFTFDDMRIAYTHIFGSREFEGQPQNDSFGALTFSMRY